MIVMQDKRDNPRLNINLSSSVRLENEEKRAFSIVRNISNTGIFLTTKKEYDYGSIADCIVSLDDESISFKGEVVRNIQDSDYCGYGIHITEIEESDNEKLNKFVEDGFYTIMNGMTDEAKVEQACQENVISYNEINNYDRYSSPDGEFIASDGIDSRVIQASFPFNAIVEEYDFSYQSAETRSQIEEILKLDWIGTANNVMLLGSAGSGKTHLAIGIGIKAIERDYKVSFTTMNGLLSLMKTETMLPNSRYELSKIYDSRVIIIDDAGMMPLSKQEANMFFQFVNRIYGKVSILMTSDLTFEQLRDNIGDVGTVNLLHDRLAHNVWLNGLVN